MSTPAAAAGRFMLACLLGIVLGVVYAFLRPPRNKHPHLADSLFLLCLFPTWIYLGFGVCGGDLRLSYTIGLLLGIWVGAVTLGRVMQPVFGFLWKIFTLPWRTVKNFFKKMKKLQKNYWHPGQNGLQ